MPNPERKARAAQRFPLELPLEVTWKGTAGRQVKRSGTIRDISTKGVYFFTDQQPPIGVHPELFVRLPVEGAPGGGPVLRCRTNVLRVEPQGVRKVGVAARIENYQFDLAPRRRQRRSPRLLWRTKVFVAWEDSEGLYNRQPAETEIVNAHGGLIRLNAPLPPQQHLQIIRPQNNESIEARVVWHEELVGGAEVRLGIELDRPNANFWGVRIPGRSRVGL